MTKDDIRWVQRFDSYKKAFAELGEAVALSEERPLSKLEEQGMIQVFEFTHELAWKCLSLIVEQYFIEFEKLYETLSGFTQDEDE
ncbi:MAG: hypothetical protein B6241_13220 [Spirochaetaceae bacterium 4572_59]|nr:MAG: hypothetical protein B6241_13220 [Spirochaetaceae bacterium 4572_59]